MLIEWTQNEKEIIHEVGVLEKGEKYEVHSRLGEQLILQGKAKEVKEEKLKKPKSFGRLRG